MFIKIVINCVDGDTEHRFYNESPEVCKEFLNEYDHEGSNIRIEIHENDNEKVYKLLEYLNNFQG